MSQTFAHRLRMAMDARGLNANKLAAKCGISPAYFSTAFKRNTKTVSLDQAEKIAPALGVRVAWLMSGEAPMTGSGDAPVVLPEPTPHMPPVKSETREVRSVRAADLWSPLDVDGWIGEALQRPDHPIYSRNVIATAKVLVRDRTMKMDPAVIVDFCAAALAAAHHLEKEGMLGEPEDEATKSDILAAMMRPAKVAPRPGRETSAAELTAKAQQALASRGHEPDPGAVAARKAADARAARKGRGEG